MLFPDFLLEKILRGWGTKDNRPWFFNNTLLFLLFLLLFFNNFRGAGAPCNRKPVFPYLPKLLFRCAVGDLGCHTLCKRKSQKQQIIASGRVFPGEEEIPHQPCVPLISSASPC